MATIQPDFTDHEARLFPSSHIKGVREAELRAAASLLAVLRAVSEFGRAIARAAGAPAGRLKCYTEVPFQLKQRGSPARNIRPDGIIQVIRGKTSWIGSRASCSGRASK